MYVVTVEKLFNSLNGNPIHENIDVNFISGNITAIVGPSGCGKTTLLRTIIDLQRPLKGNVKIFDTNFTNATLQVKNSIRNKCGMLFQQGALFSSFTIAENIIFPLKEILNINEVDALKIAAIKLDLVGLDMNVANKYPSELSGGMIKRASLARSLALDPDLLLLDEPTAGLDPKSADSFNKLILSLKETLGLSIIMVTHDIESLWKTADKVVFLAERKLQANLSMEQLYKSDNKYVKEFFASYKNSKS
jgi:phospholipid/cholesterol/gamma-HCH transport system ATP-binding protein